MNMCKFVLFASALVIACSQSLFRGGSHSANFVYAARSHVMQEVVVVCPDADGQVLEQGGVAI